MADGTPVFKGMKAGDVDPRGKKANCFTASDKALAVGGGVLEAVLHLTNASKVSVVPFFETGKAVFGDFEG
ncbi:hypothetical protein SDC9_192282 [bioreactor metagenome]|uniref:Uncharacterized protein n=1 Tax=bioreactor metagenome TaxID=1076179 RepID=A0A645I0C3_9ZZZZ